MGNRIVSDDEAQALTECFDRQHMARLLFGPNAPVDTEAQRVFRAALTGIFAASPHGHLTQGVSNALFAVHVVMTWGAAEPPTTPGAE